MSHTFDLEYTDEESARTPYATDASIFSLLPSRIYYPKSTSEISNLVSLAQESGKSLTVRAGGTCMSGGPLSREWVVDLTRYMNGVSIDPTTQTATVEAGAYFRDIEDAAREHGLMFAPYPSSHRICGIGGMIGNNASGEKSLRHGPTSENILELEVVLADGTVEITKKKALSEAVSEREQALVALARAHGDTLRSASGRVPKAASGYRLEKVIENDTLSEIPLIVGAQGTLGIVTKAVLHLTPIPTHTSLLLISAQSLKDIPRIIEIARRYNPEGLETFDSTTYEKARMVLAADTERVAPFLDSTAHLFILAQFSEDTGVETEKQARACMEELLTSGYFVHAIAEESVKESAWNIRRNSFTLMRDHNHEGFHAVPCIEDIIVPHDRLDTLVEELSLILKRRNIHFGFHGHIGDGSLRIIPVFDFSLPTLADDIMALTEEVTLLVKRLEGNTSADHSDGIIRTPFLELFYGTELCQVFQNIKNLYDPKNLFNPKKKVGGSKDDIRTAMIHP